MRFSVTALLALAIAASVTPLSAQTYPEKPIRLIIPFAAGGGADAIARPLAQRLSESLGQSVILDNRGGANGNIGAAEVARSEPDGYTLLFANSSLPISASLYKRLAFDVEKDFKPIGLVSVSASVLVTNPSLPAKSVKELVALAKAQPGKLNYGSAGSGSTMHLAAELFKYMTDTNLVHVPYRGAGPVISDLVGGHLQVVFINIPPVLGNIRGDQVRPLAVTTMKRSSVLPDVPTLDEAGLPGYESTTWYGIMGPKGLPDAIVTRVNQAIAKALQSEEFRKLLADLGSEPTMTTPKEFGDFLKKDIESWAKVVKISGATAE